jgi:hypothetical protein
MEQLGATSESEPSTAVIPARVPTSELTKEVVLTACKNLFLDDIVLYLKQYRGKELVALAQSWGYSIRDNSSKSTAIDIVAQGVSMINLDRMMSQRYDTN